MNNNPSVQIYDKFNKSALSNLPRALFKGRVIIVQTAAQAARAVNYLLTFPLLGVDTETRPSFRKGVSHKVALLQVSTADTCFLFRLNRFGLTPELVRLFEDESTAKVGLSLHDDIRALRKRQALEPHNIIEIQDLVREIGIKDMSLQKIYANLFGEKISKSQQLSNWEADVLSEGQQYYAATDAWACLRIYERTKTLMQTADFNLVVTEPLVPVYSSQEATACVAEEHGA